MAQFKLVSILSTAIVVTAISTPKTDRNRMLIIQPLYTNSHERVLQAVAEHLIEEKGYQVTMIRYRNDMYSRKIPSMEVIERRFNASEAPESGYIDEHGGYIVPVKEFWDFPLNPNLDIYFRMLKKIGFMLRAHCKDILDAELIKELRSRQFAMAIVDLYTNECGLALAHELELPVVAFWGYRFIGHQYHGTMVLNLPSVNPTSLSNVPPEMSFWQRLGNTNTVLWHNYAQTIHHEAMNRIVQSKLPGLPPVQQLLKRLNVVLIHSSFLAAQPMALPPNMHFTGCLLCHKPRPLPAHLETFMNSSGEHGVVVFSFGLSMFISDIVPLDFTNTFLRAFANFPQKFLMRIGKQPGLEVPPNVMISDFIPQMDVLGHQKTRVFISHCGVGSVMESLYSGVPILAVPGWLDQGETALHLQQQGLALVVERYGIDQLKVETALRRLLSEPQFSSNVKRVSQMYQHETGHSPMKRAAHWVDLVARFGDLDHLQLSDHLQWYEYWLLDVLAVYAVTASLAMYMLSVMYRQMKRTTHTLPALLKTLTSPVHNITLSSREHCKND